MNISDSIQLLMLLVAAIAIVVSSVMSQRAIKASMSQSKIQTFAEYTKRFQDILMAMPKSVYDGSDTIDNDVLRFMGMYFNLCSEEYYLYTKGHCGDFDGICLYGRLDSHGLSKWQARSGKC